MRRSMCCSFGFILITFGPAIVPRPLQGQTISFFREFSTPQIDRASAIAADATGVYVFGENVRVPANAVVTGNAVPFILVIGSHWMVDQVTVALR